MSETETEAWQRFIGNVLHALLPESTPRQRLQAAQWLSNQYATIIADHALAARVQELEGLVAQAYPAMEERQKESPIGYKEVQDAN